MGTDYVYLDHGNDDGTIFGQDSSEKISVWGATPGTQAAHITSVSTAAATTTPPGSRPSPDLCLS